MLHVGEPRAPAVDPGGSIFHRRRQDPVSQPAESGICHAADMACDVTTHAHEYRSPRKGPTRPAVPSSEPFQGQLKTTSTRSFTPRDAWLSCR